MPAPHFRTLVAPESEPLGLPLDAPHLLLGSCFSTSLGTRLRQLGLPAMVNPFGTLYHPFALAHHLNRLLDPQPYNRDDLVEHEGLWASFHHHGSFSDPDPDALLTRLNDELTAAAEWFDTTRLLSLTLGSAWGYYHFERQHWVANCHRHPSRHFRRRLTPSSEMAAELVPCLERLTASRPEVRIVVTVSPVRHLRDAPTGNSLSKAHLTILAHELCHQVPACAYFPAAELLLDDLRDYRFYAEDMVHPSDLGVDYIWKHYCNWAYQPEIATFAAEAGGLARRLAHRSLHPDTAGNRRFVAETEAQLAAFLRRYPFASTPGSFTLPADAPL